MKSILLLIGSILISFAVSCVPEANYNTYPNEGKSSYPRERKSPVSIEHTYELQVVDIDDTPISEAMVEFYVKSSDEDKEDTLKNSIAYIAYTNSAYTDSEGKFLKKLLISKSRSQLASIAHYDTFFRYKVTKKGYSSKIGALSCTSSFLQTAKGVQLQLWSIMQTHQGNRCMIDDEILGEGDSIKGFKVVQIGDSFVKLESDGAEIVLRHGSTHPEIIQRSNGQREIKSEVKSEKIRLIRLTDYFKPTFLSSRVGMELKDKILPFIETKIFESLTDSYMETRSIDLVTFKGKKYLKFKFVNDKVYNSLRLTKYDIAKILFDEVIRKILNPLNSHISGPTQFYGYDLTVIGHTESFIDEYIVPASIEYRFIISQDTVRRYKDKDISGQDLLNESIILMDDERIELKLQ
jgi:hypothetical protein